MIDSPAETHPDDRGPVLAPIDYATPRVAPDGMPWWMIIGSALAWLTLAAAIVLTVSLCFEAPLCGIGMLLAIVPLAMCEWYAVRDGDDWSAQAIGSLSYLMSWLLGGVAIFGWASVDFALDDRGIHTLAYFATAVTWFGFIGFTHRRYGESQARIGPQFREPFGS